MSRIRRNNVRKEKVQATQSLSISNKRCITRTRWNAVTLEKEIRATWASTTRARMIIWWISRQTCTVKCARSIRVWAHWWAQYKTWINLAKEGRTNISQGKTNRLLVGEFRSMMNHRTSSAAGTCSSLQKARTHSTYKLQTSQVFTRETWVKMRSSTRRSHRCGRSTIRAWRPCRITWAQRRSTSSTLRVRRQYHHRKPLSNQVGGSWMVCKRLKKTSSGL